MTSERDLKLVYSVAVVLFIVAIFCYAAFPSKPPDDPIRIEYRNAGGNVLFQHAKHNVGYGVSCYDCHHHPVDDDAALIACGECHPKNQADDAPKPEICLDCHSADEIEDTQLPARTDAFHQQCTACHAGIGEGPTEKDCSQCHSQ